MKYYIITLVLVVIMFIVWFWRCRIIRARYQDPTFIDELKNAKTFLEEIQDFDDYVTWKQRDGILRKYQFTHNFFEGKTHYYSREQTVGTFNETFENFKDFVDSYNDRYVKETIEKYDSFFEVEGHELDSQQREAVVTDEYSSLVVAGAGSGKTLTILGKVLFYTPAYIQDIVGGGYLVKGSCGQGNKAMNPWVCIFDTRVTNTATYGIYIVYLFRSDMTGLNHDRN